ncbi:hypothetical protein MCOR27_002802 [Pyricularia oryzae]|nr:hypothetical protein MCOR01_005758 [Pyricularia oryzae]KAH9434972.1 hypothetical protein MCOR02_003937 [Pyricularia oryzae]KAI6253958.1 hypothetical protein MCOR19_009525 [Pyricularia oryzae]KAI6284447.1 hypothetical protein MCOR27_002802 [Pyricularia oryzae]KAI6293697.1 hypothetical protein MCOR34_009841 [Pyricularia oryzae]
MTSIPVLQTMSGIKKLSFASVVSSPKEGEMNGARQVMPSHGKSPVEPKMAVSTTSPSRQSTSNSLGSVMGDGYERQSPPVEKDAVDDKVVQGLKNLKLGAKPPSLVVNGSCSTSTEQSSAVGNSQTPSDVVSQKADSNSEFGTKPPSLDGKSITSGTTFNVLDEKESLRPDDSASVKAATDEDDAFSIRGSQIANSRMGSDVAGRLRTIQIGDMPPRAIAPHSVSVAQPRGAAITPDGGACEQPSAASGGNPLATTQANQESFNGFYSQNPDEKLLEAMKSSKDRIFLLRLEKEVIEFVQDSKEPFMDLPPCNSFCRLLTHKLADYYHMTHSFEAVAGAVRIYRTPFCRVPPSLQSIAAANESASSTPPPAMLPRKIMRRGEEGDSAPASAGPSKPTSEDGSDAKDKNANANQKLTREEREEAYNKARLRIFGSSAETETSSPDNEDSTGVSRASSVSARDKSALGKRGKTAKQRRDDSESFDSRSLYTPYYTHPHQPHMWAPVHVPVGGNGAPYTPQQQPPQPSYAPMYASSGQPYTTSMTPSSYGPPYAHPPANSSAQLNAGRYPAQTPAQPGNSYSNLAQGMSPQPWPHQQFNGQQPQAPYLGRPLPSGPTSMPASVPTSAPVPGPAPNPSIPYPYGQLPCHTNPHDPKSQHPIPGSYNRHGFNPKTQSFIPGTGPTPMSMPHGPVVPAPSGPFAGPNTAPQAGSPMMSAPPPMHYGQQSTGAHPTQYVGMTNGFTMMRQGSNNSISQHYPLMAQMQQPTMTQQLPQQPIYPIQHQPPGLHLTHPPQQVHNPPQRMPNKPPMGQGHSVGPTTTFTHLPTYGNPSTLPQKPST